jgi:CHAT domain-containing protein
MLRDAINAPGAGDRMFFNTSHALYEMLISVAAEQISKAKRVVIVPDGKLFGLPFEALLTKPAGKKYQWNELPFFARSVAPAYAPSASVYLRLERAKTKKHARDLLAFGDPEYSSLEIRSGRQALDPLPHTRSEVLAVSARIDEERRSVYLGRDASEAALKQEIRNGSPRILHLATHGLIDPAEPAASSVVLAADEAAGEDGYLYTLEILSLPFDVGLVIVSACESARGRIGRGEGVVGLSRSFLASGARGVVASLWAVSDESTSVLMNKFYEKMIAEEKTAAEALNEARLSMMDKPDYSHPFHWSAFVFIGADRSLW